jgi:hypothetical protein|tara:strand:+ start:71 stop:502 length:432 start_codon:yes stop_codon:yes gene_type:complete
MPNRRFNTQVAQPRKALAKGGKALKAVDKEKNPGLAKLPTKVRNKMGFMKKGGRVKKMGGGMSTARKDMMSGYYKNDMGMKGGKMFKDGGKVGKKQQGYKARKDESIAMRIRKPRTARQLKASRDESYGKFGSKAKKSGKINR